MLSVIIIAKNEEHTIARCLASIQWADQIIVLDSGSTDRTVEIAKSFTKEVYSTDWQGYGIQKQRALSYATQKWVLNLDADEYVDLPLKGKILEAMQQNQFDAFRIPIQMIFYNKALRFSSSPTRHIRLFKKAGAQYSADIVHEKIILPNDFRVGQMKCSIKHDSFRDVSHALNKLNRYSSYSAKIRLTERKPGSFLKTIGASCWMFFRCYLLQLGFLDGKEGFLFAAYNAQGTFYRGIKLLYPDINSKELP